MLALSLPTPALAAEGGNGIIDGQVVNGTRDGGSVAGIDVTLKTYLNDSDNETASATVQADAEGYFAFEGLSTGAGYSYQAEVEFQKAKYNSDKLTFTQGEPTRFTEVIVYDSTESPDAVRVEMAHTIIYVGRDSLQVKEFVFFVNDSDRTYIGSREIAADGTRAVSEFSLPGGATGLTPLSGLMECCIYSSEDGFVESMPLLPGAKEEAFSYQLEFTKDSYTLPLKIKYPTANYNLLVQGGAVSSDQLTLEEPLDMGDMVFARLSGSNLAPGDTVIARLSGLPREGQNGILWAALTLLLLTAGSALLYLRQKQPRGRSQPVASADRGKESLLEELSRLDDAFADGQIDEEAYRRLRSGKKEQLIELMRGTK